MGRPSIGGIVHYVARGSADGRFPPACRAATVTEVADDGSTVGLHVMNPTGLFFHPLADGGVAYHDGGETPGAPDCPNPERHGDPYRYCACGIEAAHQGGTWHWPEKVEP